MKLLIFLQAFPAIINSTEQLKQPVWHKKMNPHENYVPQYILNKLSIACSNNVGCSETRVTSLNFFRQGKAEIIVGRQQKCRAQFFSSTVPC